MTNRPPAASPSPVPRSLKARQRDERTALILGAAQEVFAEKGYHESSIDEIAARVGIAKGTVYLHFASKEELLEALVAQQIGTFLAMIDEVTAEATTVRARLERILDRAYRSLGAARSPVPLEFNNRIGWATSVIEKRASLKAHVARGMERIAALLEEGKRTGELDTTVPTPIMVATFVGLLSPHGFEQLLTSGQVSPAELVMHVSHILFRGPLAPSSTEA